jgi:hypothetical protein
MMSAITICIWISAAAVTLAVLWWRERQRSLALRQIASKFGFVFLGNALPGSLNLTATGLERISSCWNVIDGELNGVRIVVFDCRIGEGKGSWRRTVIAAKDNTELFRSVPFVLDLRSEPAGEWALLYQPKTYRNIPPGLMAASEVDSLFELFSSRKV